MSLRLTANYRVLQHIGAFALAWLVASYLFVHVLRTIPVKPPTPGYHIGDLGKGEVAVKNLLYLSSALRDGRTIVVLGSSELNTIFSRNYVPYVFFPQHHLAKVVTYGREGFETLAMYGFLSGLKLNLNPNTRLVILLSPDWFKSTDLLPEPFERNFNDSLLLQLYMTDDPRGVFHDYLTQHQADFRELTSTQRLFLNDPGSILNWDFPGFITKVINNRAYTQREKLDLLLSEAGEAPYEWSPQPAADVPWIKFEEEARQMELRHMKNNNLYVRDSFYSSYIRLNPQNSRQYFPKGMDPEPEMTGFKSMIEVLRHSKVNVLFVMQPLNPRTFDDMHRFDAVDSRIAALCREYGMDYMDMYAAPFEPGVLRDPIHLGELGWEKVDKRIAEHFGL